MELFRTEGKVKKSLFTGRRRKDNRELFTRHRRKSNKEHSSEPWNKEDKESFSVSKQREVNTYPLLLLFIWQPFIVMEKV
jgi:hypothetical protein